jgi:aspartyl protease family protein
MDEHVKLYPGNTRRHRWRAVLAVVLWLFAGVGNAEEALRATAVALFKDKAVLIINGKRRVMKSGDESPEGVVLITSTSESAVIKIDDKELTLRLDGKIVGHYPRGIAARTLQLYPDRSGHYLVDGLINGNGVRFLVDTGATSVVINKTAAKRIGLLYRVDGRPTMVETASGVVPAYTVQFDEVKVRALSLKRVEGLVVDGNFPRVALLGQSFLNRLNMRRDGQMLELQER